MSHVLIAGRDAATAVYLVQGFRANGFTASVTDSLEATRVAARSGWFDLLLLDAVPPCLDGFAVLEAVRDVRGGVPAIILTGGDGIGRAPSALRAGADDFLVKPFAFEELLARVRVRLHGDGGPQHAVLRHGPIELDLRARRVCVAGRWVTLTAREFMLTETFLRNRGQVLSRQQLLRHVWEYGQDTGSNAVDVYVCRLRRKLGPGLISTVRGMGYRLEAPPRAMPRVDAERRPALTG